MRHTYIANIPHRFNLEYDGFDLGQIMVEQFTDVTGRAASTYIAFRHAPNDVWSPPVECEQTS